MATGWLELSEQLRALPGKREAVEQWWSKFTSLMQRSQHLNGPALLKIIEGDASRYVIAGIVAGLLAPTQWPVEWEEQRPELIRALGELRRQTRLLDPGGGAAPEPATFFAQIELGEDRAPVEISHRILAAAEDLLVTPCRRDQMGSVAGLCNLATASLRAAYQRALARQGAAVMQEPLLGAHLRYRVAVLRYDDAAAAMNDTVGSVLFHPFDAAGATHPALVES